jgi:predicted GNAT superfamily acetyltransferase
MTSSGLASRRALTEHARTEASAIAAHAGVDVDILHSHGDLRATGQLFVEVWRTTEQYAPVGTDLMRALVHSGNYVAGAHRDGRLIAASIGFVALDDGHGVTLHSHIAAVAPGAQGGSVGHALKLHQRAWALARGISEISWTFDPLVRRNGWFNLGKLGARGVEYHVDFYGPMTGINAGDPSDRLLVSWRLDEPAPDPRAVVDGLDADVVLQVAADGAPRTTPGRGAGRVLCQVPDDIIAVRTSDPDLAHEWRRAVRDVMVPHFADGFAATGMTRTGYYVLERAEER